jgi:hypothetical protein
MMNDDAAQERRRGRVCRAYIAVPYKEKEKQRVWHAGIVGQSCYVPQG